MKLDVGVIKFSLLTLFFICEKDSLLIEGLQIDQVVEGEAPGHPSQVLKCDFVCVVVFGYDLGKVSEENDE